MSQSTNGSGTESEDVDLIDLDEQQSQNQDSDSLHSEDQGGNIQSPFSSGRFAGKTVAEAEEMMASAEQAVIAQGRNLTQINRRLEEMNRQPEKTGTESPIPEVGAAEYFQNPMKYQTEAMRSIIQEEMAKQIAPFKQNLVEQSRSNAYAQMEAKFPKFKKLRQMIDQALEMKRLPATVENLEEAYYLAVGIATEQGYDLSDPAEDGNNRGSGRQAPPQHRPSNQPIAPQGRNKPTRRKLTEEERAFCRQRGWSEDRFFLEMEADEEAFMDIEPKKEK